MGLYVNQCVPACGGDWPTGYKYLQMIGSFLMPLDYRRRQDGVDAAWAELLSLSSQTLLLILFVLVRSVIVASWLDLFGYYFGLCPPTL